MFSDIRKCVAFKFKCRQTWDALTPTEQDDVRHCATCDHHVYYCQTDADLLAHAEAGHCVARRMPLTRWSFVNVLGRPELSASREDRIDLYRERLEQAKTFALQFDSGPGRCARCGFPVSPDVDSCGVCWETENLARETRGGRS